MGTTCHSCGLLTVIRYASLQPDPPFNKGEDFHATPDSLADGASFQDRWTWEEDVHDDWVDQITDDFPRVMHVIQGSRHSYGDSMGAFLCFMAVRLLEMKRILRDDGSIYLHCDHTASHYLKELMDAIFNVSNFRNEIIWHYPNKQQAITDNFFLQATDTLLFYSKTAEHKIKQITSLVDPNSRGMQVRERGYNSRTIGKAKKRYIDVYNWEKYEAAVSTLKIDPHIPTRDITNKETVRYEDNCWEINIINPRAKERTGYPTQKPLQLYERIIEASSNRGDVVLDPFAGCATTCVAAERLNRQWVGMDIWDRAKEVVIARMKDEGLLSSKTDKGKHNPYLFAKDLHFTSRMPIRTDDGDEVAPVLEVTLKRHEPKGKKMSREEMKNELISEQGIMCQGCYRVFDDARYLELDHNTPRSDGGLNHISNRTLLCSPCNKVKSNNLTLSGLRQKNKELGYLVEK